MRLSPGLRLFVASLLLAIVAGAIWWIVGLPIGAGLFRSIESVLRRSWSLDERNVIRVCFLAVVVVFTGLVAPAATGKWLTLGAIGVVAGLVEPEKGGQFSTLLLVLSVPAVLEMGAPPRQAIAAVACGILVALPAALEMQLGTAATVEVTIDRGLFFFAPLLFASPLLERWVLKRVGV